MEEPRNADAGTARSLSSLRKSLAGDFGIMVIATTLSSALNYFFNIIMNRMLGRAAFGDFYSMQSALLIITMGALSVTASSKT